MEVRICDDEDVIGVLMCAKADKSLMIDTFDNWGNYQKWLLDAIYGKQYQVLVVNNGIKVIGFLVWQLYLTYLKWSAFLHFIYVDKDYRNNEVSDELMTAFMIKVYNSSAQGCKFDIRFLPDRWVQIITSNVPSDKYNTYHIKRTDELKEWYNKFIRPKE
ncbi:MAG: hypothetical protein DRJ03_18230 [Chloroflexi bacterium]|nr:MAG: hypothetical protein DRJ03_18230 [Chloroflexota bacterium]